MHLVGFYYKNITFENVIGLLLHNNYPSNRNVCNLYLKKKKNTFKGKSTFKDPVTEIWRQDTIFSSDNHQVPLTTY